MQVRLTWAGGPMGKTMLSRAFRVCKVVQAGSLASTLVASLVCLVDMVWPCMRVWAYCCDCAHGKRVSNAQYVIWGGAAVAHM